jgi:hypothetical protein
MCQIINKTHDSVYVAVKKWPLRIMKKDGGGVSNPIEHNQWFKFKWEHDNDVAFSVRFKKVNE